ncbi:helix-turn-helix domain-containing protein [Bradyrhizobium sp. CCBAU 51753]|uniref:helix-turn-helix domain-containing protein n=1 Tax=Bradyrhizobium sp. CCBAU 51753 TaxID=1325100 RepID=UPI00188CB7AD|nr:hypothetical protein XH93_30200 [Bradyrhizobium sp. CCBAU 51753]
MSGETCTQSSSRGNQAAAGAFIADGSPMQPHGDVIQPLFQAFRLAVHDDQQRAEAHQLAPAIIQFNPRARRAAASGAAETSDRRVQALQKWRLKRVVDYVDRHIASRITLLDLAAVAGLSRMHFASQFRAATGLRPHEFLLRARVRRAEELMQDPAMTLLEIALAVGFQTQAHFTTVFKRFTGCTPRHRRLMGPAPARIRPEPQLTDHL